MENTEKEINKINSALIDMSEAVNIVDSKEESKSIPSNFALSSALEHIQLIDISDGEGSILYFPKKEGSKIGTVLEIGDVLFLREKPSNYEKDLSFEEENGLIIQIITLGTASYPQSETKALFRVMVNVRASILERSHNEPPETIDELLEARFKVKASIVNGNWNPPEGRVVTRNVDIFQLNPKILSKHIFNKINISKFSTVEYENLTTEHPELSALNFYNSEDEFCLFNNEIPSELDNEITDKLKKNNLDINLGDYKGEPVEFFGSGFEKINLITGMKGGGKSHIAKGIISESLRSGMSAIVFDINNEYVNLPGSTTFTPGENFKFRLDRVSSTKFLAFVNRIAPFAERTEQVANAELPRRITQQAIPDIDWIISQSGNIITRAGVVGENMRDSFEGSLRIIQNLNLIMTRAEINNENEFLRGNVENPDILSLSSALYNIEESNEAGVIVFNIGGFPKSQQFSIVDMIIDTLKVICGRQYNAFRDGQRNIPNYPTIYFEEAHMYMEPKVIDELLPLIRHYGMNVFFITNTPGALPESVFRLIDNLIMTRLLNKKDIDQVKNCGLTDTETIEGFAHNLKEHHALLLSGRKKITDNFPLVFKVRDFNLPQSGETKSMWEAMSNHLESLKNT